MDILFFTGLLLSLLYHVNADSCTFQPPCACNTFDYKIDLSPMMKANKNPLKTTYLGAIYYLNPCDRHLDVIACQSLGATASGCQLSGPTPYGIASTSGNSAKGDPKAGTVIFQYSFIKDGQRRTSEVTVKCSSHERKFTLVSEYPKMTYNFLLETKYACKHIPSDASGGLSTGSILLIVFFVLLLIYFIGGFLFLKYYQKAEGFEAIPNISFWKGLPALIKDGFVFVIGKVRGQSTYDKI